MKYTVLLGVDLIDEEAPYARIDDFDEDELVQIISILIKKDIQFLVRQQGD